MVRIRVSPRETLAVNLKRLMEEHEFSAPYVASKAKLDRKTINNMLNSRFDPGLTKIQQVAEVFGLSCWQLLSPNLNPEHARQDIQELLDIWMSVQEPADRAELKRHAEYIRRRTPPKPPTESP